MKLFLVAVTLAIAASAALAEPIRSPNAISAYNYHRTIGIPKAQAMKRSEMNSASRIIKGEKTDITEVPYQVGLIMRVLYFFESVCGGSLITSTKVLTAAHCADDGVVSAQSFTVVLGSNTIFLGGQRYTTTDVTMHPNWFPLLARNDVAVLKIPPVTFSDTIQPIALPSDDEAGNAFIGEKALASGYGLTSDDGNIEIDQTISSVYLDIVENSVCVEVYGVATISSNVCTHNEDQAAICSGDSGGPLAVESNGRRVLVGVSSYGHRDGCELGYPNAFARITSFLPWINSIE